MMTRKLAIVRPALVLLLAFTLLTGIVYPVFCTLVLQVVFPHQADGSLVRSGDRVIGSELIGQSFTSPGYFWGRASAATPPYNPAASQGSNMSAAHPALYDAVKARVEALHRADPKNTAEIPVDLVTASGSGLDPDISLAAALYQVPRVARVRRLEERAVSDLVYRFSRGKLLGVWGELRVNVLELNMALDAQGGG